MLKSFACAVGGHRRGGFGKERHATVVEHKLFAKARAAASALSHLVDTFFRGSKLDAVATLLELEGEELSREQLDELSALIERAREREAQP